ncbi:hypothetical protein EOA23_21435 [Mesorhizobium sp. M2A.F.Ca.ET.042.01.1.1]|uniref:hypothetical protein n=1 Tax=Mesorhizobium sp. M2A.F.Ca.ET.042.01.1.1 TaxID=2496745 RepID=UPI000FCCC061|nr:hypothetical protein [Mesorhizobium sp. M2A.F.Ca.ET.042.01.1.1]RUX24779.1 hypothetical protein EOA23_21435 [Mesorhizobium sp. M2A.F.Ca.ET.042.01.1.1]
MLKVFGNILVGSLALALFVAIAGAIAALVGSIGEFPTLKQLGGSVSILGVFGFFAAFVLFRFVARIRPQSKAGSGSVE